MQVFVISLALSLMLYLKIINMEVNDMLFMKVFAENSSGNPRGSEIPGQNRTATPNRGTSTYGGQSRTP